MKLFDIPTDNLYKFMALSGLVLIIASYIPFYHGWKAGVDIAEAKGEGEIIEAETDWARKELDILEHQIDTFIARMVELTGISKSEITAALNAGQSLVEISKDLEEHQAKWQELEAKSREHLKLFREQIIKLIRLNANWEVINYRLKTMLWLKRLAQIGALAGGFLAGLGFRLWYTKLQVPQDLLIKQRIKDEQKQ